MADASEILRDAQYALHNVSHGSTDSKKFAAKAKSLANRVIRKFPSSSEVVSARSILRTMGEQIPVSMTRNVHTHSAAGNRSLQHQDTSHRRSADLVIHDAVDTQLSVVASKYLLPGWPIRLMQAVSIGSGLVLLLRGLNGLSLQYLDVENLLSVGAGAYLIVLPRLRRFDDLVANMKVRMFTKEDWVRNSEHLPTRQDLEELVMALVQGNIDQAVKWLPDSRMPIIETYRALSEPHWGTDLMIWPEAAITVMAHNAGSVLEMLDERAEQAQTALVLGLPALERLPDGELAFRNTAVGMGTAQGRYVKRRLVPFGEYVPLEGWLRGLIELFDLPMSHASPGARSQPLLRLAEDQRAAMAICYEIIYPSLVREQARRADVLITISNDSWFGASIGPLQHLQMAQMRALENGRWLLRDTNNGVTAIVDHRGEIVARLPQFTADVLTGHYRLMRGNTPYSQLGEGPLLGALSAGLLFGGWRRYRRGN